MTAFPGRLILASITWLTLGSASAEEESLNRFFQNHCVDCHGEEKQKGKLTLHEIDFSGLESLETLRMVEEQIRFEEMPPEDEEQPSSKQKADALGELREVIQRIQNDHRMDLPKFGNYVDHDRLFRAPPGPVRPARPGIWRLRGPAYTSSTGEIASVDSPLSRSVHEGFEDYAALSVIDEPSAELLIKRAGEIVSRQTQAEIFSVIGSEKIPKEEERKAALQAEFQFVLKRLPSDQEMNRFLSFWEKNLQTSGHPIGSKATLMTVLMLPEALHRIELGDGEVDQWGRVRLTQFEVARSVSWALRDELDDELIRLAQTGELGGEELKRQLARMLSQPVVENPRLVEFFREYFGYQKATGVFKDPPQYGSHEPEQLVSDLEALIVSIVEADHEVFRRLLTTDQYFVNWDLGQKAKGSEEFPAVYGFPVDWKWTSDQPVKIPGNLRAGVLTHPAWLVAWSGNFDNDPVRRGKWVRTHLLGGTIPDVPIGVDARVPENEKLSLRERLHPVTSKSECWRCHRKMDPLGLPFEQYSHLGRIQMFDRGKKVDSSGVIDRVGEELLDGLEVENSVEMVRRLAESERAEQVFVRHVFRFLMGRNETLGDAATLQKAWRVYRENDGSFKALVGSILTSDSFLMRQVR